MCRILERRTAIRREAIPVDLLIVNQRSAARHIVSDHLTRLRLSISHKTVTMGLSMLICSIFSPQIPRSETLVAYLWVRVPL